MQLRSFVVQLLSFALLASATRVHHRPVRFKTKLHLPHAVRARASSSGMVQIAYFTNWGIYGRNFQPTDIDAPTLTHILYSFADVSPSTGELKLSDTYADLEKHYPGDSWSESGNNLYGCFKQLYLLKLKNRNLKVLLSVGGWTYSQSGHFNFVTDASKRATFVQTAVKAVENYALDGIDIDFEYPTAAQKSAFTSLMLALRQALDALQSSKGDAQPYLLTAALPAGLSNAANFDVGTLANVLDYFNLMTYDYAGSWSSVTGELANLYDDGLPSQDATGDGAIKWWTGKGAPASKVVMGLPLYGRGFENTTGLGKPYNGVGQGTWEAGVYDYSVLPFVGATVIDNTTSVSSYSYDSTKKQLISYDTPAVATLKAQYAMRNGLAGAMYWELSGDKKGTGNLIRTVGSSFGSLAQSQNHIAYPGSVYDNVRNYMGLAPGNSTIPTTTVSGTTTRATSTGTSATTTMTSSTTRPASSTTISSTTTLPVTTTSSSSTTSRSSTSTSTSPSTTTRGTSSSTSTTTSRNTTSSTSTTTSRATISTSSSSSRPTSISTTTTTSLSTRSTTTSTSSSTSTASGAVTVTVTVTGTCGTSSSQPSPSPSPSSSSTCDGLNAYSPNAVYTANQSTIYNGRKWTAKWWTQAEAPSTAGSGVWRDDGAC
ncbi:hypothetical protein EXIGLDRAFT_738540 [Exidia glandulosa HHB12029]|uniref:chitinase n=1 Tax=Exidia glandulosa HHB12029 TaxID=1314781 RepID=A0A165NYE4_EXIGL|nr:hypothetical protein EXIGLDRAFT_738540 [Exidia glandulosa HHB12029]